MQLKIKDKVLDYFESFTVSQRYNSVASTFSFSVYYNPDNATHRELFKPCQYAPVTVTHGDELLITGTLLNGGQTDGAVKELRSVSGYSTPGVLEDCEIPTDMYPLQTNGLSLKDICSKFCKKFGLQLVVDSPVAKRAGEQFKKVTAEETQKIKAYLSELAAQKHIILTHDAQGRLVLTEALANQSPVFHFEQGMPGIHMAIDFDAQGMHSEITVHKQATVKKPNAAVDTVKNPYVTAYRPRVVRQSSGDDVDTKLAARNVLSEELRGIRLVIDLRGWTLNGKIVRPNTYISVKNPDLHIYNTTMFFIEQADLVGDREKETARLTCVLPEVYNNQTPKNIFS